MQWQKWVSETPQNKRAIVVTATHRLVRASQQEWRESLMPFLRRNHVDLLAIEATPAGHLVLKPVREAPDDLDADFRTAFRPSAEWRGRGSGVIDDHVFNATEYHSHHNARFFGWMWRKSSETATASSPCFHPGDCSVWCCCPCASCATMPKNWLETLGYKPMTSRRINFTINIPAELEYKPANDGGWVEFGGCKTIAFVPRGTLMVINRSKTRVNGVKVRIGCSHRNCKYGETLWHYVCVKNSFNNAFYAREDVTNKLK